MFAKNPNQVLALRHQKMDTASLPVKGNPNEKKNKKEMHKKLEKTFSLSLSLSLSLSTKPKTQKKEKKKHKMKAPDQPNQKIKMPGPEFSCRSKNAASCPSSFPKKKPYATNTTHHTQINKQSEKLTSRVHRNCIYLWTETHCDDTNIRITRKRTERVRSFVRSTTNVCCLPACLPAPPSTPNPRNTTCTTTTNTLSLPRQALCAATAAAAERRQRRLMSNKPTPEKEKKKHTHTLYLSVSVRLTEQTNKQY